MPVPARSLLIFAILLTLCSRAHSFVSDSPGEANVILRTPWRITTAKCTPTCLSLLDNEMINRRTAIASSLVWPLTLIPTTSHGIELFTPRAEDSMEGIASVTRSALGQSVRRGAVRSAQVVDRLDQGWERFSDGLRDKKQCDPKSNRRRFDNGVRRDGTPIGNPVLGALCDPVPLQPLDERLATLIVKLAEEAAGDILVPAIGRPKESLQSGAEDIKKLVAPSFSRAADAVAGTTTTTGIDPENSGKIQAYNLDIYSRMRSFSESITGANSLGKRALALTARKFETLWGKRMLEMLAQGADRKDFVTSFPLPDSWDTEELPYAKEELLDALGKVCVVFKKMQDGGLIGNWEVSIPEDDYGSVVTIAVDDDISIGAQVFLREQGRLFSGSVVSAVAQSALDEAKIPFRIDSYFIDPSTTRQELYNPTQVLVSLSNLGE